MPRIFSETIFHIYLSPRTSSERKFWGLDFNFFPLFFLYCRWENAQREVYLVPRRCAKTIFLESQNFLVWTNFVGTNFFWFLFFKLWMRKNSERIFIVAEDMHEDHFIRGGGFSRMQNIGLWFLVPIDKNIVAEKIPRYNILYTSPFSESIFR